jgi:hypothetical protein
VAADEPAEFSPLTTTFSVDGLSVVVMAFDPAGAAGGPPLLSFGVSVHAQLGLSSSNQNLTVRVFAISLLHTDTRTLETVPVIASADADNYIQLDLNRSEDMKVVVDVNQFRFSVVTPVIESVLAWATGLLTTALPPKDLATVTKRSRKLSTKRRSAKSAKRKPALDLLATIDDVIVTVSDSADVLKQHLALHISAVQLHKSASSVKLKIALELSCEGEYGCHAMLEPTSLGVDLHDHDIENQMYISPYALIMHVSYQDLRMIGRLAIFARTTATSAKTTVAKYKMPGPNIDTSKASAGSSTVLSDSPNGSASRASLKINIEGAKVHLDVYDDVLSRLSVSRLVSVHTNVAAEIHKPANRASQIEACFDLTALHYDTRSIPTPLLAPISLNVHIDGHDIGLKINPQLDLTFTEDIIGSFVRIGLWKDRFEEDCERIVGTQKALLNDIVLLNESGHTVACKGPLDTSSVTIEDGSVTSISSLTECSARTRGAHREGHINLRIDSTDFSVSSTVSAVYHTAQMDIVVERSTASAQNTLAVHGLHSVQNSSAGRIRVRIRDGQWSWDKDILPNRTRCGCPVNLSQHTKSALEISHDGNSWSECVSLAEKIDAAASNKDRKTAFAVTSGGRAWQCIATAHRVRASCTDQQTSYCWVTRCFFDIFPVMSIINNCPFLIVVACNDGKKPAAISPRGQLEPLNIGVDRTVSCEFEMEVNGDVYKSKSPCFVGGKDRKKGPIELVLECVTSSTKFIRLHLHHTNVEAGVCRVSVECACWLVNTSGKLLSMSL